MKSLTIKLLVLFVAFPSCFLFGQKAKKSGKRPTPQTSDTITLPTPQGVEATKGIYDDKIVVTWRYSEGYRGKVKYILLRTHTKNSDDINFVFKKKVKVKNRVKYSDILFSPLEDKEIPWNRVYYYHVQAVLLSNPEVTSAFSVTDYGYLKSVAAAPDTTKKDSTKIDTTRH